MSEWPGQKTNQKKKFQIEIHISPYAVSGKKGKGKLFFTRLSFIAYSPEREWAVDLERLETEWKNL